MDDQMQRVVRWVVGVGAVGGRENQAEVGPSFFVHGAQMFSGFD